MSAHRRRAPRFYFNLRSPYSWLAVCDLDRRYPDVAQAIQWRPFWEPGLRDQKWLTAAGGSFPYSPMTKDKHLYILQDVKRLAADRGLAVRWPVDVAPRWEVAHHPYFIARRHGRELDYVRALGRARWERGEDICDIEVVAAVASELGLTTEEVRGAVDAESIREEATTALLHLDRDGVFGVPFFIAGPEKFWGIDRLPRFADAVRSAGAAAAPLPEGAPAAMPRFDDGHAGGCG
ncbi:2-hydroxychromene-2-carboxylate isomerase [Nocardia wallacei]|uniref:2-hydroxychromene-2-carboxylate isomerase n=1 Tax=Nocardia wallacei TaxID=480035 RepID=UPI002455EC63|nr:DsbA family protein [Nocardia wallacei]